MDNLSDLLFSFRGRINRKPYWLGSLAIGLIIFLISFIYGFSHVMVHEGPLGGQEVELPAWLYLIFLPFYWPLFALLVKRLHDRNKSAWWLLIFVGLPFVLQFSGAMVLFSQLPAGADLAHVNPFEALTGTALAFYSISVLGAFLISLWCLVEVGFLSGTKGPNQFGEDPLAGQA